MQQPNNQQQQQQQPQITITQEDYAKYSNDALNLLAKLQQQKQMQGQINGQMKEAFIKNSSFIKRLYNTSSDFLNKPQAMLMST